MHTLRDLYNVSKFQIAQNGKYRPARLVIETVEHTPGGWDDAAQDRILEAALVAGELKLQLVAADGDRVDHSFVLNNHAEAEYLCATARML